MPPISNAIRIGSIVRGPTLPEPIEVLAVVPMGNALKVIGRGLRTGLTHDPVLTPQQLVHLSVSADQPPFDGDARLFRLGIEAHRLGLAYEYDPFFSLSIARVDPLPHQLEAVYGYFMQLPRIRFLLADDPGAGKTIMAGLLLKELKARGLVRRVLIVTPANLTFQWQRELTDKFRERFDVIRGDVLRANYGQNPWQERDQVITSVSWVSVVEDARESLLRSRWDLVIVDEAHKMSARSEDHKTYAYRLGENLSKMTDHFLLMTATPHKGDPDHFRRFLALLDADVYGSIESLQQAIREHEAPFYLRRTKEALVTFPDSETGEVRKLFTNREVRTAAFDLDGEELDFYDELTRYVEDQSMAAAGDPSARGRAVGFTMAMLQRRMASSIYAVRRSLERMRDRREKILENPDAYRQEQIERRMPEDFDDLTEEEQQRIVDQLEEEVLSADPAVLREEIGRLTKLIEHAKGLESRDVQSKLNKLRSVLNEQGIFNDPKMRLLIFTEHKDTLDYLAGDGRDKLRHIDLGQITSSSAGSLVELIVRELQRNDEITEGVSPSKLIKYWPPAMVEWSTKAVRDAFYSSPQLPRLLNCDTIKRTICDGVSQGTLGYASKDSSGRLKLEKLKQSLIDADVEISDDMYILKAEDAQKLLEPPRLAELIVRPEHVVLKIGEQASFSCAAVDQYGEPFIVPTVAWSATGGTVTADGLFTAGQTGGLHTVRADAAGYEALAEVRITTKDEPPLPPPPSGEQIIRWRGTVPPQKWMNLYTKVLTRFASNPGLRLEVSFEVPIEREQADGKVQETRAGLKELGLEDNVT